ncbi:MAG TPA: M28 family peptidase [Vicinamibacterales bacterium]
MRRRRFQANVPGAATLILLCAGAAGTAQQGQGQQGPSAPPRNPSPANMPLATLQDLFVRFPLPPGQDVYAGIDGRHLHQHVVEQANISRRYRDAGHPKFWGRIIGTSADAEDVEWMIAKFKAAGLKDVRAQTFDLVPQWFPQAWEVSAAANGRTISLESAQPDYGAAGTSAEGLDLEAVYVGLGSEADFAGREVKGKAVFVFSMLGAPNEGAVRRADAKGAAAIFEVNMLPGNTRYQAYPSGTRAPAFTVGHDDGVAARDLIGSMPVGQFARVKVTLDVRRVPNLKTAQIWGTLPGATDETIYILAHRDGWFDASGDNAGGVASMLGLAAHFAKLPQAQRKRTMIFVALDGHHNSGDGSAIGNKWLVDNRQTLFAKTALAINVEHPSTVQTQSRPRYYNANEIVWGNTYMPQQWYAGGPSRPELEKIATEAFRLFGATMDLYPSPVPPASDMSSVFRFLPGIDTSEFHHYFHTDLETPQTVPWTGLEASTRAYAKIIDEVNKLPLVTFQRPEEPLRTRAAR